MPPMSARRDEHEYTSNGRRIGLLAAALLSVLIGAVLLYAVVLAPDENLASRPALEDVDLPDSVDIDDTSSRDIRDIVQASEEGRIELYAEDGEISQVVLYDRFEPLAEGRFRITNPRATAYLDDGRIVELSAERAEIVQRQQGREPESGRFEGDVQAHLFSSSEQSTAAGDIPEVSLFTDRLAFDTAIGEIRSDAPIRIESPAVRFAGEGLTLLFSEQERRLLYLRIDTGDHLTVNPQRATASADSAEEPAPAGPVAHHEFGPLAATPPAPRAERIDLYRAALTGPVTLTSGPRTVRADRLEFWTRLVGGNLAPDAILPIDPDPEPRVAHGPALASAQPESDSPAITDRITLEWDGPLELRPLESESPELARDDLFVRFSSPQSGLVRLIDDDLDAAGQCVSLDYGFRSRLVTLAGLGPQSVSMTLADRARFDTGRLELDLAGRRILAPTPGLVTAIGASANIDRRDASGDAPPRDIAWTGGMEFSLVIDDSGEIVPDQAVFSRDVRARDADASVEGERLTVSFRPSATGGPSLSRVIVEGDAVASSSSSGRVAADRLDLTLDEPLDGGIGAPKIATAAGNVRATRDDQTLRAELAELIFAPRSSSSDARIERFTADLGVSVRIGEGDQAIEARAERISAFENATKVDLVGEPATIRRGAAQLSAGAIRLDSNQRSLTVFGPGEILYRADSPDRALGYDVLSARWQSSMTFDDRTGVAEFAGDALAAADLGETARDTATGERLIVELTPFDPIAEDSASPSPERELIRATLHSAIEEGVGDEIAELQSRRYRRDPASETGLELERLVYLSGERIVAEASEDALRVPGGGKLLIDDRTTDADNAVALDPSEPTVRGATMFQWDGSLLLSRATGQALLKDRVRMRHRPLDATDVASLECERIEAEFSLDLTKLIRAEATGAVYAAQGTRQIVADAVSYDAQRATATATANPGSTVTLFDDAVSAPLTAEAVLWDLKEGTIRALGSGPVRTDR